MDICRMNQKQEAGVSTAKWLNLYPKEFDDNLRQNAFYFFQESLFFTSTFSQSV